MMASDEAEDDSSNFGFRKITSLEVLASSLNVSKDALFVVEILKGTTCAHPSGCPYPAGRRNTVRGHEDDFRCVVHHKG